MMPKPSVPIETLIDLYQSGMSFPAIGRKVGLDRSTVRRRIQLYESKAGKIIQTKKESTPLKSPVVQSEVTTYTMPIEEVRAKYGRPGELRETLIWNDMPEVRNED